MSDARARLARDLEAEARAAGFHLSGIAAPHPSEHSAVMLRWIEDGLHGEMAYLARPDAMARRPDPALSLAGVRSVLLVTHEYGGVAEPAVEGDPSRGVIARYARGRDYHRVVKKRLRALLEWLRVEARARAVAEDVQGVAYVDTGPVLERELAARAGLGWFGRNTMLIHPDRGSWFFIGALLLDLDLPTEGTTVPDRCGSCRRCLDACPTGALLGRDADGAPLMDARLCISYLTIELRGPIPPQLRPALGNRVFGCDICQEVCPWNERFGGPTDEPDYQAREGLDGPSLVELAARLLTIDDEGFRDLFRGSPVRRAGRAGLLRNVCVALGNWGAREAVPPLTDALEDPEPLVREHAAWALERAGSR